MKKTDQNQTKQKKKLVWQQYIGFAFMVLIGAVCGIVLVTYIDRTNADIPLHAELLLLCGLFLSMYVAFFFHTLIHEAGHLVFGLLTGYKFSSFRILSFMWVNANGKIRFKRYTLAGTGGQCLMAPPDLKDGRIPLVLYNLGGSIINLAAGALFLACYLLSSAVPFLSSFFLIFAVVGVAVALMNGIPMRMGAVDNDGYHAFALRKNKEAIEAFWVQLKVAEQSSKGIRIKDMPKEWFGFPSDEAMKNSLVAARGVFACNRLMDEENFEEADALMAHMLSIDSGIIGVHHDLLVCDRIYVELIRENRRAVIENMLTREQVKFMKVMKRFPSVLRTEYALALLYDNDSAKAQKLRADFEKAAKTYPYPHEADSERDLMDLAQTLYEGKGCEFEEVNKDSGNSL